MTASTIRYVDRAVYLGGLADTLREKVFCSAYWQTIGCREVETDDGVQVRIDPNIYPPGGPHQTAMRLCRHCRKWTPPASLNPAGKQRGDSTQATCADCEIEQSHEAFKRRVRKLYQATGDEEVVRTITALYWKRHHIQPETPDAERARLKREKLEAAKRDWQRDQGDGKGKGETETETETDTEPEDFELGALLYDGINDRLNESVSIDAATVMEQRTTGGQHWLAEALEMTQRPVERRHLSNVLESLHKHLTWVSGDGTRRAMGCGEVLLGETEASLLREIAYYHKNGRIIPSARRADQSRHSRNRKPWPPRNPLNSSRPLRSRTLTAPGT